MTASAHPDHSHRAALALFHAARSGTSTGVAAIAAASGLSIDEVRQALAPLADDMVIIPGPVRPGSYPPHSSEWSTLGDELHFEMLPWLAAFLEGLLDYSPADDEARVRRALDGQWPGGQDAAALAHALGVPKIRVEEALIRLEHRDIEEEEARGTRMRVVLEVTFPTYRVTHDDPPGHFGHMLDRWMRAIEANEVVPCRDVAIKDVCNIPSIESPPAPPQ
jgi:hypothetical protein